MRNASGFLGANLIRKNKKYLRIYNDNHYTWTDINLSGESPTRGGVIETILYNDSRPGVVSPGGS